MDYLQVIDALRATTATENPESDSPGESTVDATTADRLDRLALRIRRQATHELALRLWSENEPAGRLLAVRLADPEALGTDGLDRWASEAGDGELAEALVEHLAIHHRQAGELMLRWATDEEQCVQRCGFLLVAKLAEDDPDLDDRLLEQKLQAIEQHLVVSTHEAKEAMSNALSTIGQRNERLSALALEVARRLGPIEIEVESGRLRADPVRLLQNPELAKKLLG